MVIAVSIVATGQLNARQCKRIRIAVRSIYKPWLLTVSIKTVCN